MTAITMVPIHKDGQHQRSLQVATINDAYTEIRRHANKEAGDRLNKNVLFLGFDNNPVVKFVIIKGDAVEVIEVKGFKRLNV